MTARQIRRAAGRKASKQARKAADASVASLKDATPFEIAESSIQVPESPLQSLEQSDWSELAPMPVSPSRLAANRANAQLSTGPKTPEGKAKSCLNAVRTGLTGRTVLLPSEDAKAYQLHVDDWFEELRPVGVRESALAQSLADNSWRVLRLPALEMGIYALGRIQFANQFDQEAPALRPGLIEVHTFLIYEKQLRNLQLQFGRLCRQSEKDTVELRHLQQERGRQEKENLETAAKLYVAAKHENQPFDPAQHGFEFSTAEIESFLERIRASTIAKASLRQEPERAKSYSNAA